jgi:uncharacterized surface protein with fasciclin (FAS1) repeats
MVPRRETRGCTLANVACLIEKKEKHHMANIIETARAEHAYDKYVKGLESVAGLVEALSGPGYYTADDLLDRMFLKTLEGQRLRVWSDVSEVPLGEEDIATGGDALSYISSDTVTTAVRESIKINGGHVLQANVIADNGIMHVIDKVLIPQFTML